MKYLVIDSGTTNSRVRLCDEKGIIKSVNRQAGAKDVSITGSNEILKSALREGIEEILEATSTSLDEIKAVIASGMISSNVGLAEVPHIPAPAGKAELAQNMAAILFSEIIHKPILFIPGIKTGFEHEGEVLSVKDIMRGEETEIFGCLDSEAEASQDEILFMHYGSHHKCIKVKGGRITECRTSITGEMLMSLSQDTILKSSLMPVGEIRPLGVWVREGLKSSESSGFGRSLFSIRVLDVMEKKTKQENTSFYLGVLLSLDMELISALMTENTKKIILYGKTLFPFLTEEFIRERYPHVKIEVMDEVNADSLSAKGAVKIYENSLAWRECGGEFN